MQIEEYEDAPEFGLGYRYGFNDLCGFGDGVIEIAIEGMGADFSDEFVRGLRLGREEGREQERAKAGVIEIDINHETDETLPTVEDEKVKAREAELKQWEEDYEEWRLGEHEQGEGYGYI